MRTKRRHWWATRRIAASSAICRTHYYAGDTRSDSTLSVTVWTDQASNRSQSWLSLNVSQLWTAGVRVWFSLLKRRAVTTPAVIGSGYPASTITSSIWPLSSKISAKAKETKFKAAKLVKAPSDLKPRLRPQKPWMRSNLATCVRASAISSWRRLKRWRKLSAKTRNICQCRLASQSSSAMRMSTTWSSLSVSRCSQKRTPYVLPSIFSKNGFLRTTWCSYVVRLTLISKPRMQSLLSMWTWKTRWTTPKQRSSQSSSSSWKRS